MPNSVIWELEPHTLGKHKVLREYLNAWFPIMGLTNNRILFIDGFAGPGKYEGGEPGSPFIALETYLEHTARPKFKSEVRFIFIEKHEKRADHLRGLVSEYTTRLPANASTIIHNDSFDLKMKAVLNQIEEQEALLAPSFVMIDPFGVSDTPMAVIQKILCNPKSEIYISLQYESINRFKETSEFEPHLDSLFGAPDWRHYINIEDPNFRKQCLYTLYSAQLKNSGAKHVVKFDLFEGNRLIYTIFFATKHELGADCMKKAIWKIAPWGDYAFKPYDLSQLSLGIETPNFEPLKQQLMNQFRERGWVLIEEIERYMMSDKTSYHSGHLRDNALKPLEDSGEIQIDPQSRRKRRTYPKGTRIKFVKKE